MFSSSLRVTKAGVCGDRASRRAERGTLNMPEAVNTVTTNRVSGPPWGGGIYAHREVRPASPKNEG